ncbi:MAG TPA: hypothetical protein VEF55_10300 [Candidatus Binatia bacterium]|nr:hypothetical protein [Candidatus Binatia bacterium]
MNKEQLLAEFEDLLRTMPPRNELNHFAEHVLSWRGRARSLVEAWELLKTVPFDSAFAQIDAGGARDFDIGYKRLVSLIHEGRFALRSQTVGPIAIVANQGAVFDYFDEMRKIIEGARSDVFFVDRYLDAEFVARYLPHVATGTHVRLMARDKIAALLPAVKAFVGQHGTEIEVREAPNFHDRFVFIDRSACYHSGGSFKDGPRKSPISLYQVTDAFAATSKTYEDMWSSATVHL